MKRTDAVAMGLIFLVGACAPAAPMHDAAADRAALDKVRDAFTTAFKAGNAAGIAALYTADATLLESEQPTVTGPQAIEAAEKAFFATMASQEVTIKPEKVETSGDLSWEYGTFKLSATPKGGAPMTDEGRYVVVSKRQADGSWKLVADMGNRIAPAAPAMPAKKK